jgi:glycosyltransferase involved in cell wall biosynthesis
MSLKILFLSYKFHPEVGGIESNSEVLANAFVIAGHQVRLLTRSTDTTLKEFNFDVIRNPNIMHLLSSYMWADCVFENNPSLQLDWPGIFFRQPSFLVLHTWISRLDGRISFRDYLKFSRMKQATQVIAVSNALRRRCWQKAVVINNPYPEDQFKLLAGVPRTLDFVFLGRLVSDKGVDHAILALDQLNKQAAKNFSLTIIGDGPERRRLEALVVSLHLNTHVHFMGTLLKDELTRCLNQHHYILVPSIWEEPFGNVVLEGMACGCLPITSDGGGLPEAVGKAGLIYKRGNLDALVSCIRNLLKHPELESQIRAAIPAHLLEHQQGIVAKRYLDIITAC